MDQGSKRSRLGSSLTTLGGVLGVAGVLVWRIGLKATITPDTHNVVLLRSILSIGGLATFGLAIGLIVLGAFAGRRKTKKKERPVEHQAQTDPLLPEAFGLPEGDFTSTSTKLPDER